MIAPDPYVPCGIDMNARIIPSGPDSFTKIYCRCGRIVDVDTGEFRVKKMLKKEVECPHCRNLRIAAELDMLGDHYMPLEEEPLYRAVPKRLPNVSSDQITCWSF